MEEESAPQDNGGEVPPVTNPPVDPEPAHDAPKVEETPVEAPQVEQPAVEAPQVDQPAVESPQVEQPTVDAPQVEQAATGTPQARVSIAPEETRTSQAGGGPPQEERKKSVAQEERRSSQAKKSIAQEERRSSQAKKSIAQEERKKSIAQEERKKSIAQEERKKSVAQEERRSSQAKKSIAQEERKKSIAQEERKKSIAQEERKKSIAQEERKKSIAQEERKKSIAQEERHASQAKKSIAQEEQRSSQAKKSIAQEEGRSSQAKKSVAQEEHRASGGKHHGEQVVSPLVEEVVDKADLLRGDSYDEDQKYVKELEDGDFLMFSGTNVLRSLVDPHEAYLVAQEHEADDEFEHYASFMDPSTSKRVIFKDGGHKFSSVRYSSMGESKLQSDEGTEKPASGRKKKKDTKKSIVSYTMGYDLMNRFSTRRSDSSDLFIDDSETRQCIETLENVSSVESEEDNVSKRDSSTTSSTMSISRYILYDEHDRLASKLKITRFLNQTLQNKLAIYYRRRNARHVLKEDSPGASNARRYHNQLDKFEQIRDLADRERGKIEDHLNLMKNRKISTKNRLEIEFEEFQRHEREVGSGLVYSKTGNEISERYLEHLIKRQRVVHKELSLMRLKWLQLKTMVEDKEAAIAAINYVDKTHCLTDFERLKAENLISRDKLEERETELTKVRLNAEKTIQIVAHIREKISATSTDIEDLLEEKSRVDMMHQMSRTSLADLKTERDAYRRSLEKSKQDSGLLTHDCLLRDMEDRLEEREKLLEQLEVLQQEFKDKSEQVKVLRGKLEEKQLVKAAAAAAVEAKKEVDDEGGEGEVGGKKRRNVRVVRKMSFRRKPSEFETELSKEAVELLRAEFLRPTVVKLRPEGMKK